MKTKFCFEKEFTRDEYARFAAAVENREEYEFCVGKRKDGIEVRIHAAKCDNGCWLPENYFWSADIYDHREGFNSCGIPFSVSQLKSYDDIVFLVYDFLQLPRPEMLDLLSFLQKAE